MPDTSSPSAGHADLDPAAEIEYRRARERLAANDLDGAAHWLEQAAAKNHPAALTELAITFLHGFGRDIDPAKASQLLLRADASGGTPETSYLLAQIATGDIVLPRNPARIDAWLADSARRGHGAALRVAGLLFGQRPEAAFQQAAAVCLDRATDARDPVGAALFADRLHAGLGVKRDPARAMELAGQLRAMNLPVELPAPDPAFESLDIASDPVEPPWSELRTTGNGSPTVQRQCEGPEVVTCDRLMSDEECRYLIYSGSRFVEPSLVIHPTTGRPLEFGVRTSQDMAFLPTHDDVGIRILQSRMAALAGFGLGNCEPLTLLHYGPGDEYRPHRDYFFPSAPQMAQPGGQRHSTVCAYLNAVERGGETVFPEKQVTVQPRRGGAVMFRSLLADGSPDSRSLHAGLPVLAGEKWLATCWIRVRNLRSF